ncbi:MAG: hypothetical protein ACRD0P_01465 [Stackebrandtia sp.]
MRIIRNVGFASLGIWLLLPLLFPQWRMVMGTWSGGEATSNLTAWGIPMLSWGRLGKIAQFLAGLVVILDLLDPDKLRSKGSRAGRQLADIDEGFRLRERARELHGDRNRLFHGLVHIDVDVRARGEDDVQVTETARLRTETEQDVTVTGYSDAKLRGLRAAVWSRCPDGAARLGSHQLTLVREEITRFLHREHPDLADHFDAHATTNSRLYRIVLTLSAIGFAVGVATPLTLILLTGGISPWLAIALIVGLVLAAPVIILLVLYRDVSPLVLGWHRLLRLPPIGLYTVTAAILDKARPGHVLRWAGLFLFIHGFALDLLAS